MMEEEEGRPLECVGCKCLMGYSNQLQAREGERFECVKCSNTKKAPFQERAIHCFGVCGGQPRCSYCQMIYRAANEALARDDSSGF